MTISKMPPVTHILDESTDGQFLSTYSSHYIRFDLISI